MNHSEYHDNWFSEDGKENERVQLSNIDKKIISSVHTDARKTISDIASEIGYSVKTVRKELDKLIDHHVLEFSINWNPSSSGNIVPFIHIYLSEGIKKENLYPLLRNRYKRLIFNFMFHNISNLIVSTAWVENLQQLQELKTKLESEEGIEYVKPIIIYSGHHFPTWRDQTPRDDEIITNNSLQENSILFHGLEIK
jgi:DNA-binding Lrp family transcriptional regulator